MKTIKKPKFLLSAIAILTLIAVVSTGAVCGALDAAPWLTFLIDSFIGVMGLYAYHRAALMILHIRFSGEKGPRIMANYPRSTEDYQGTFRLTEDEIELYARVEKYLIDSDVASMHASRKLSNELSNWCRERDIPTHQLNSAKMTIGDRLRKHGLIEKRIRP